MTIEEWQTALDDYGRMKARMRLLTSINEIRTVIRRLQRTKGVETRPQVVKLKMVAEALERSRKGIME